MKKMLAVCYPEKCLQFALIVAA